MAVTGGDESDAVLVAHVYGVLIAHGSAGVGDSLHARLARDFNRVAPGKGEKRIRGEHGALRFVARLFEGDAHGVHAVGLTRAHTEQTTGGGDGNGVGLDVLHRAPRELERFELLRRGLDVGHGFKRNVLWHQRVRGLFEPPAADLAQALCRTLSGLGFQNTQSLRLALQHFQTFGGVRRGDDDFVKHARLAVGGRTELANFTRHVRIDRAVESNDTTERRDGIGAHSHAVSFEKVAARAARARDAARVGVLHDDARRVARGVIARATIRSVGIEVVVVTHFLAVVLDRARDALARGFRERAVGVHRRRLVRVLAVTQRRGQSHRHGQLRRGCTFANLTPQIFRHHRVVRGAMLERLPRQHFFKLQVIRGARLGLQVLDELAVIIRIDHDVHVRVILRRRTNHRRPTDIDILHALRKVPARRHGFPKRVQVHAHHVDGVNIMLCNRRHVRRIFTLG
mmetsp:Transcript_2025/g.6480  ORF Transcript_2025/g.6480 Transcript_2025/m.6480 type:complete len:456 (+) Transcript_2025:125-1492(+)